MVKVENIALGCHAPESSGAEANCSSTKKPKGLSLGSPAKRPRSPPALLGARSLVPG